MAILTHDPMTVHPTCECEDCDAGRHAEAIGMVEPTIDRDLVVDFIAKAGCYSFRYGWRLTPESLAVFAPVARSDADEVPAEYVPTGPSAEDEAWYLENLPRWALEGACGPHDLSPEERALEALSEPAWDHYSRLAEEERRHEEGYPGW